MIAYINENVFNCFAISEHQLWNTFLSSEYMLKLMTNFFLFLFLKNNSIDFNL